MNFCFADRLKNRRSDMKLKQSEIATVLGVTVSAVSLWERGKAYPNIEDLAKIAEILNCTSDYLLGRTDDPEVYVKIAHTDLGDAIVEKVTPNELTPAEIAQVREMLEKYNSD